MKLKKINLLLFFFASFLIATGQPGHVSASMIKRGAEKLISTEQTRKIDELYQQAEEKIRQLEQENAEIRAVNPPGRNANIDKKIKAKEDSLENLINIQTALITQKDDIIKKQGTIITRQKSIIADKNVEIYGKNLELEEKDKQLAQKDRIIDSFKQVLAKYRPIDNPDKKDAITFYGRNYKANETIIIIDFDAKNTPLISASDSADIAALYNFAVNDGRKLVLTGPQNMEYRKKIQSDVTGSSFQDSYTGVDLAGIVTARLTNSFGLDENNLKVQKDKKDYSRRVYISIGYHK